jgi:hypothetical protein
VSLSHLPAVMTKMDKCPLGPCQMMRLAGLQPLHRAWREFFSAFGLSSLFDTLDSFVMWLNP